MYIELIGYFGSLLVVVSMLMTSVVKLRIINTIGSVIFTGYAIAIHSYPTAVMNACLVAINLYNIFKIFKSRREYSIVRLSQDDAFIRYFLDSYELDIKKFFPKFNKLLLNDYSVLICRGTDAIGIFLGKSAEDGTISIRLDYTTPAYRDTSVGKYLYAWLATQNIPKCTVNSPAAAHCAYLAKMGFSERDGQWIKEL